MKKTILLLLLNCGFLAAQTKTLITSYGEKVNIELSPSTDNLGNHTATETLNLDTHDIDNVSTIFIKKDAQFLDKNSGNSNSFSLNKNDGTFGIYNSSAANNPLSIDETSSKTTLLSAQITKNANNFALSPQKASVAVSGNENGDVDWKPLYKVKGATTFQVVKYSDGNSIYNSKTFNEIPGLTFTYTAPANGYLIIETNLYTVIPDAAANATPTSVKTEMAVTVNGLVNTYGTSLITTTDSSEFLNGGGDVPEFTATQSQYLVLERGTYTISVRARTADQTNSDVGSSVGIYKAADGTQYVSSLLLTLVAN